MPDESNRALQALQLRILELRAWRNRTVAPLPPGSFQAQDMQKPAPFKPGDPWPSRVFPVHITFSPVVPDAWRGNPVRLYLDVEGEALLRVDGQPKGGLLGPMPDGQGGSFPYQREYELTPAAQGGETIRIDVDAVPRGRFGVPVREPHFRQGYLLVPDPQVRSLYEDLLAVWDVAQNLDPAAAQGEREFLVDLLQQVVARVRLPDSRTGNYLAALGRDPAASAPLFTVWDEWDLSAQGEPAALGELHRRSLEEAAALLQAGLAELRQRFGLHAAGGSLALAGHAHIDLAWLWPLAETRRKAIRTFSSVLTLMERYPDFVFSQSAAQLYAFVEADDPQLFRRIQARVAEGRWEPIGGTWVEMDCNLASGESLVRQFLYGQRYFQRAFGRKSQVLWLPDTFGFTGALPQIAHQAGIRYFFTTKLYWNDRDLFPYDLYWWEGIDGTRLLAHLFRNENQGYNGNIQAFDLLNTWKNFRGKARHPESLFSFGWGDGGGGPTEEMLERYQRLKDFPGLPQSRMSTAEAFFERVDTKRPLPVWVGEQYLEFHRGTYTTQGRIKWLNRHCEQRLYEAEALAALAARLGAQAYPREALAQAWQTLLRNQFHDILPGSSVRAVYEESERELGGVLSTAVAIRDEAAKALAARTAVPAPALGTGAAAGAWVVWNLHGHPRRLEFLAQPPAPVGDVRVVADGGQELPVQKVEEGILVAAPGRVVEGVGYQTLAVYAGRPAPVSPLATAVPDAQGGIVLENELLRVTVLANGALGSVYDKRARREVLEGEGNQLVAYSDRPATFDAWDVDADMELSARRLQAIRPPAVLEAGPVRAAVEVVYRTEGDAGGAVLRQRYLVVAGSPRLDIRTEIQWTGRRTLIKALFPLAVRCAEATFETAYGAVTRPTHRNTSWDQARFEVPAHRWADLSEGSYGVSLLNDGRYGHSAHGNVLGLTLLRSPIYPDPFADEGPHHFTYALYPHSGDWRNGTVDEAAALNSPLLAVWTAGARSQSEGQPQLPPEEVLLAVDSPALQVGSIKLAEDGDGLVVRLYEAHGSRGKARVETGPGLPFRRAEAVNLLEEEAAAVPAAATPAAAGASRVGFALITDYKPYQILTIRLQP